MHALVLALVLPDLFGGVPREAAPATTIFARPHLFLENLATLPDGDVLATSLNEGIVYRIGRHGQARIFGRVVGKAAGIVREPGGSVLVDGWSAAGTPSLWRLRPARAAEVVAQPRGMQFPNGITPFAPGRYLIADSYAGRIWLYDARSRTVTSWLVHPLLARSSSRATFPAANGIKLFRGTVYVSNTQRALFLAIPVDGTGAPGVPRVLYRKVNFDDFTFASDGTLFATTHVYNSVVRIAPDGRKTVIAGLAEGVAGSTAAAFGPDGALYVTTNGGSTSPPPGGVQPARVVRIAVR